jgi:hypothetical protein
LAAAIYLSFSPAIFNDGDTSWHLAAGRLILSTLSVPQTDPFSFTFHGRPWTAHEWLSEAILAAALSVGSWGAVALAVSIAVAALILIVGSEASRWLPPQRVLAVLIASFAILAPFILARPHVLAWPLLAGWTLILLRAREAGRAPSLAAALLMAVWANLHGSFVMGLLLAGFFGLEALLASKDKRRTALAWGVFGAAALAAALATPHGLEGLLFPLTVSSMKTLPLIAEWRATSLSQDKTFLGSVAAILLLLLYRRPQVPILRLVLLAGLLYLAMAHARHQPIFAIIAALVLAKPLGEAAPATGGGPWKQVLAASLLGLLIVSAVRLAIPLRRTDTATYPVTALRKLPSELRALPVLNSYSFGGPLILNGVRPYIDGRADLYGDAFMLGHKAMVDGDAQAFDREAGKWGFGWTILAPGEGLVAVLDRMPGWKRLYADDWAVVHVRED